MSYKTHPTDDFLFFRKDREMAVFGILPLSLSLYTNNQYVPALITFLRLQNNLRLTEELPLT